MDAARKTAGWQAELQLRFACDPSSRVTRLAARRHRGPLVVQRPFHPEGDPCHVYVVHPPGGVVGGDELRIDVEVDARAHALITTPAATKFYRCDDRRSSQTQELRVSGAVLEWLPQENIFYPGADVRTATRVNVDDASCFFGWEVNCLGLPARGEPFCTGTLGLDFELWRGDLPLVVDRLRLSGESPARAARWGLAGQEAVGMLFTTPATAEHVMQVRELLADQPLAAVSLVDGVLVLRALAPQAEAVRQLFIAAWHLLRPLIIGRDAMPPRIWNT